MTCSVQIKAAIRGFVHVLGVAEPVRVSSLRGRNLSKTVEPLAAAHAVDLLNVEQFFVRRGHGRKFVVKRAGGPTHENLSGGA
jgi:hypothetical protein